MFLALECLGFGSNFAFVIGVGDFVLKLLHAPFQKHSYRLIKVHDTTSYLISQLKRRRKQSCAVAELFLSEAQQQHKQEPWNGKKQRSSKKNFRFPFEVAFANCTIGAFFSLARSGSHSLLNIACTTFLWTRKCLKANVCVTRNPSTSLTDSITTDFS